MLRSRDASSPSILFEREVPEREVHDSLFQGSCRVRQFLDLGARRLPCRAACKPFLLGPKNSLDQL